MLLKYVDYIVNCRNYSLRTAKSYKYCLGEFKKFVLSSGITRWSDVDEHLILSFVEELRERQLSAKTVNLYLSSIRQAFMWAKNFGYLSSNVARYIPNLKAEKTLPSFCTDAELSEFFQGDIWNVKSEAELWVTLYIRLGYLTGCRWSELFNMRWAQIDWSREIICVAGKGSKQRNLPLVGEVKVLLNSLQGYKELKGCKSPFLFSHLDGSRFSEMSFRNAVCNMLSSKVGRRLTPHALRHSFATSLLNNGSSIVMVQKLLGHESIETTQLYTHVAYANLKQQYQCHPRSCEV